MTDNPVADGLQRDRRDGSRWRMFMPVTFHDCKGAICPLRVVSGPSVERSGSRSRVWR